MVLVAGLANASNWFFYMGLLRGLGREDYPAYAAGMFVLGLFLYPLGALQALVSRSVAVSLVREGEPAARGRLRLFAWAFGLLGLVSALALLGFRESLSRFLALPPALITPLVLAVFFVFLIPVVRGYLMGREWFWALGLSILLDTFGRLALGLGLVRAGWGASGALWGSAGSGALAVFGSLAFMGADFAKPARPVRKPWSLGREAAWILAGFAAFYVFLQADLIVIRRTQEAAQAGLFAGVRKLGDAVVLLPMALVMVFQPRMASDHARGNRGHRLLWQSTGLVLSLSGGAVCLFSLFPDLILRLFAGTAFQEGAGLLRALSWVALPTALGYVVLNYGLARKVSATAWTYAACALAYLAALGFGHDSLGRILAVEAAASLLTLGLLLWSVTREAR